MQLATFESNMISVLILLVLLSTDSSAIEIPQAWAEYIKGLLNMYEKASKLYIKNLKQLHSYVVIMCYS